ncbi:hypothetical protein ACROYT_G029206 [Oculina patagonica]
MYPLEVWILQIIDPNNPFSDIGPHKSQKPTDHIQFSTENWKAYCRRTKKTKREAHIVKQKYDYSKDACCIGLHLAHFHRNGVCSKKEGAS